MCPVYHKGNVDGRGHKVNCVKPIVSMVSDRLRPVDIPGAIGVDHRALSYPPLRAGSLGWSLGGLEGYRYTWHISEGLRGSLGLYLILANSDAPPYPVTTREVLGGPHVQCQI